MVTLPPANKVIGNAEAIATLAGGWDGALRRWNIMCELNAYGIYFRDWISQFNS